MDFVIGADLPVCVCVCVAVAAPPAARPMVAAPRGTATTIVRPRGAAPGTVAGAPGTLVRIPGSPGARPQRLRLVRMQGPPGTVTATAASSGSTTQNVSVVSPGQSLLSGRTVSTSTATGAPVSWSGFLLCSACRVRLTFLVVTHQITFVLLCDR